MLAAQLKAKMKTLTNAYKSSIDNNRQTGAESCDAPFMKQMEEIFGCRPMISSLHTTSVGNQTNPASDYRVTEFASPKSSSSSLTPSTSSAEVQVTQSSASSSQNYNANTPAPSAPASEVQFKVPRTQQPALSTCQNTTQKASNPSNIVKSAKGPDFLKKRRPPAIETLLKEKFQFSKEKKINKQKRFEERVALIKEMEANKNKRFEMLLASRK